jgi:hypothetical protein
LIVARAIFQTLLQTQGSIMRHIPLSMLLVVLWALPGAVFADSASDSALEARIKALEQRVAELEARISAPPSVSAQPGMGPAAAPAAAAAVIPTVVPRWKDKENWGALKIGLAWSQVKALLGPAGRVSTGVFGDVWYYPDDSGGRVIFDRDGRVTEWDAPSGR